MKKSNDSKPRIALVGLALLLGLSSSALALTPHESGYIVGGQCMNDTQQPPRTFEQCCAAKCNAFWPAPTTTPTTPDAQASSTTDEDTLESSSTRPSYQECYDVATYKG